MKSNRLSLNCNKTEVLWRASRRRQSSASTAVQRAVNQPSEVCSRSDLLMWTHVQRTISRSFTSTPADSSLGANGHVPNAGCLSTVLTGLDFGNSWRAFRFTWSAASSRCWMRLRDWRIISADPTTSLSRWSVSIGCACHSEFSSCFASIAQNVPQYIDPFDRVADLPGRRALRSTGTIPSGCASRQAANRRQPGVLGPGCRSTNLERSYTCIPADVASAESLSTFRYFVDVK